MNWTGRTHPVETLAEWGAPLVLALATAWAATIAGLPFPAKTACGVVALLVGVVAMRVAGKAPLACQVGFEPATFGVDAGADELLLDQPVDELLLDDPLEAPDPASRVVRLFDRQDPTPGELVLRISDYLSDQGKVPAPMPPAFEQQRADASDALHAALANIRANLR
ncbi:hypothetical protein [Sphingomonas sp.]|uniref:hypothetical protein n=1 Tax=Sphingomonas sp. TaxID=28214 RepID=UPI0025D64DA9|nr:hypothetical protein [Sphingomonas sp.]